MTECDQEAYERGFTLIEVLVAFVILALFLGAMLPSLSTSLAGSRTGSDTIVATAYAQSLIAGVGVEGQITDGEFNSTLELTRFSSHLIVRPYGTQPGDDTGPRLYEVTAQIHWRDGVRSRAVSLTTIRYAKGQNSWRRR